MIIVLVSCRMLYRLRVSHSIIIGLLAYGLRAELN